MNADLTGHAGANISYKKLSSFAIFAYFAVINEEYLLTF
jgi:hypothetical protein